MGQLDSRAADRRSSRPANLRINLLHNPLCSQRHYLLVNLLGIPHHILVANRLHSRLVGHLLCPARYHLGNQVASQVGGPAAHLLVNRLGLLLDSHPVVHPANLAAYRLANHHWIRVVSLAASLQDNQVIVPALFHLTSLRANHRNSRLASLLANLLVNRVLYLVHSPAANQVVNPLNNLLRDLVENRPVYQAVSHLINPLNNH